MIVVVADTSPLNYLIQIHCDHVLPALYERVFVPAAVVEELHHPRATAAVRAWLANTPPWLVVEEVDEPVDPELARLDPGERQAIQLAKRTHAPDQPLETLATTIRRIFPTAIAEYARLGRAISLALTEDAATEQTPRRATKTGRNDSCPCGSGRKYKKCCGALAP